MDGSPECGSVGSLLEIAVGMLLTRSEGTTEFSEDGRLVESMNGCGECCTVGTLLGLELERMEGVSPL